MVKLLYAGFDTFDIAFQGAFPEPILKELDESRDKAEEQQEPVLVHIGPNGAKAHIEGYGKKGGYRYILDTGPLGAKWMIKRNMDAAQWNLFASPRATALLAYGYRETFDRLVAEIESMGGRVTGHSINRVDFAMDFETDCFELDPELIVAHSHTKVSPHWSKRECETDDNKVDSVIRGRRIESVTIGKQPGRQITIYDKRREAIERRNWHWFEAWEKDRKDRGLEVWRVEVRAGKRELKEKYRLTTTADFEISVGDVINNSLSDIRYLADKQGDSNVSRQTVHPIWQAAQETARSDLSEFRSGLTPGQVKEIARVTAQDTYRGLCTGNAIGLGVVEGLSDEEIIAKLPELAAREIAGRLKNKVFDANVAIRRIRDRLIFLE